MCEFCIGRRQKTSSETNVLVWDLNDCHRSRNGGLGDIGLGGAKMCSSSVALFKTDRWPDSAKRQTEVAVQCRDSLGHPSNRLRHLRGLLPPPHSHRPAPRAYTRHKPAIMCRHYVPPTAEVKNAVWCLFFFFYSTRDLALSTHRSNLQNHRRLRKPMCSWIPECLCVSDVAWGVENTKHTNPVILGTIIITICP